MPRFLGEIALVDVAVKGSTSRSGAGKDGDGPPQARRSVSSSIRAGLVFEAETSPFPSLIPCPAFRLGLQGAAFTAKCPRKERAATAFARWRLQWD